MISQETVKKFINYRMFTDVEPYEVLEISKSGKTAKVRRMECERINQKEDNFEPGGFCGHTSHGPNGQQWSYKSVEDDSSFTMTLRKNGGWQFRGQKTSVTGGCCGSLSDEPYKYYDYNY